jgi:hypothetical protein
MPTEVCGFILRSKSASRIFTRRELAACGRRAFRRQCLFARAGLMRTEVVELIERQHDLLTIF